MEGRRLLRWVHQGYLKQKKAITIQMNQKQWQTSRFRTFRMYKKLAGMTEPVKQKKKEFRR